MKFKSLFLSLFALFMVLGLPVNADNYRGVSHLDTNNNGCFDEGEVCEDTEIRTGPCVCKCKVTKFRKKTRCKKRCVEEPYTVKKKKCRYVTKTYTKQVPEYYCEDETRYRKKYINEKECYYEPYTCWEERCIECPPEQAACPDGSCPSPKK